MLQKLVTKVLYDSLSRASVTSAPPVTIDKEERYAGRLTLPDTHANKQRGKKFRITGTGGPRKAIKLLKAGIKRHKNESK